MAAETADNRHSSGFLRSRAVDHQIARLADHQHGVVSGSQLRRLGLGRDAIDYRLAVGRLHRTWRDVYAVGHPLLTDEAEFTAGVLAIGCDAQLTSLSALALWGTRDRREGEPVYVTVPRKARSRPGLRVLTIAEPDVRNATRRLGIPVVMPARALSDAAILLPHRPLRRAIGQALILKRVSLPQLVTEIALKKGHRGVARFAAAVADARPTRSELEDAAVAMLVANAFPLFETNARVARDEVDVLWRDQGVVLELDSREFHDNPITRADDAAKQARLEATGLIVLRARWRDVTEQQVRTATAIRAVLDSRDRR